jgi:hypothetical protein
VTNVFAAVGQHRDDPCLLLLLGSDGLHYAQALPDGAAGAGRAGRSVGR